MRTKVQVRAFPVRKAQGLQVRGISALTFRLKFRRKCVSFGNNQQGQCSGDSIVNQHNTLYNR